MNREATAHVPTPEHPLLTALSRGLPMTLLVDLVDPNGPRSREVYEREGTGDGLRLAAARFAVTA
ncbi:hypothetical protein Acel_1655 [Acidothermus cellulolyticus 11B]|jgi:hypothetical protein|uniref:Uncharacterized protein n=1 Tax=Acidothermus cellulolyticus (strain ATCC 43068 / DSM 8971 / 11B) TaxID=351607 RepID=A0LVG7_ACIC1|nr:hypothetical protein [Acidothermus cellulolyticus]ABK53427.1 hypothetical protein Acel_1655 [Acidothermus cellulolyticus 11B]